MVYLVGLHISTMEVLCDAHMQVALSLPHSLEVTSEAGLRQAKLTTSCLPHMLSRGQAFILQRSQMIGFMHAMIDQGIDDLVNRNLRSHVLPADMTRVRLRGRGY